MKSLVFSILIIFSTHLGAQEVHEFYNGVRALGMGGAVIATVNDETALLSNPAGLGKLRNYFGTVIDPEVEVGSDNDQLISLDFLQALRPQTVLDALELKPDKHLHFKGQLFPSLVVPNFGVGLIAKYRMDADFDSPTAPTALRMSYQNDIGLVFGFNFRLFDGRLKIGFNTKIIDRIEIEKTDIAPSATNLSIESLASEGLGIGTDVGMILTMPWKYLPTLSILARDLGGTYYDFQEGSFTGSSTRPNAEAQKIDVALALFPILGNKTRGSFTIEARDVTNLAQASSTSRYLHTGMEVNFLDALFVRFGMNQTYFTGGLEMAFGNIQLQMATYGEEIGYGTTLREDRRYTAKFAYRF
ncbi:MAG: hypothetical protein KDD50_10215 [Bdellovibrionales bacterium]|nr:hypothetical protein [Bdellovibrionales bacterium]